MPQNSFRSRHRISILRIYPWASAHSSRCRSAISPAFTKPSWRLAKVGSTLPSRKFRSHGCRRSFRWRNSPEKLRIAQKLDLALLRTGSGPCGRIECEVDFETHCQICATSAPLWESEPRGANKKLEPGHACTIDPSLQCKRLRYKMHQLV